jgi:hypothetical protein
MQKCTVVRTKPKLDGHLNFALKTTTTLIRISIMASSFHDTLASLLIQLTSSRITRNPFSVSAPSRALLDIRIFSLFLYAYLGPFHKTRKDWLRELITFCTTKDST